MNAAEGLSFFDRQEMDVTTVVASEEGRGTGGEGQGDIAGIDSAFDLFGLDSAAGQTREVEPGFEPAVWK